MEARRVVVLLVICTVLYWGWEILKPKTRIKLLTDADMLKLASDGSGSLTEELLVSMDSPPPSRSTAMPSASPSVSSSSASSSSPGPRVLDEHLVEAETNPVFRRFNELRARGIREWNEVLDADHLKGFEKADIVEKVCAHLENHEVRQICRMRGRRMGERLMKHYPQPLTSWDAYKSAKASLKTYVTRITIQDGKLLGWHLGRGKRPHSGAGEEMKMSLNIARVAGLMRHGKLRFNGTVDILFKSDDFCDTVKHPYPITWFAAGEHTCPFVVPLTANYHLHGETFKKQRPFLPYHRLTNRMFTQASPSNLHRWAAFFVSSTGLLPFLHAKGPKGAGRYQRRPGMQRRLCIGAVEAVKALDIPKLRSTGVPDPGQCTVDSDRSVIDGKWTTFDDLAENKYYLIIDGEVACYRLSPLLMAPGVSVLMQQQKTNMSFTYDLIPYVHYLPLDEELRRLVDTFNDTYNWAEKYAATTEDIARESTRWAHLHASESAHGRDWWMYIEFLASMRAPSDKNIPDNTPGRRPGLGGIETGFRACPTDTDNEGSFFRQVPIDSRLQGFVREKVYYMACLEKLDI